MRIVDADELMEHVWRDRLDSRELIAQMIESAPTVKEVRTSIPLDIFERLLSLEHDDEILTERGSCMSKPLAPIDENEEQIIYDAMYHYYLMCRDLSQSKHVASDVFAERAEVTLAIIKSIRDDLDWDIVH